MALNIITKPVDVMKQTLTLDKQTVLKVCDDVIATMINGLSEEAHTLEVFNYILEESKEMLNHKRIKLLPFRNCVPVNKSL